MQENPVTNETVEPTQQTSDVKRQAPVSSNAESFEKIRHVTAWVMIVSAVLFALIGISAIWDVFGQNAGDVVWRAFSSLGIIAFAALIVNVAARTVENKR